MKKLINITTRFIIVFFALVALRFAAQIFIVDIFPVYSHSMEPTIRSGDRVFVNKLIFGARIYKNLDFVDGKPMNCFRTKGFRKIAYDDIVVFNHASGKDWYKTRFVINSVYVKRCIGLPGDTISIHDGLYQNSSIKGAVGHEKMQKQYQHIIIDSVVLRAYPFSKQIAWTIKEFGPLYIPRQGDVIDIDRHAGIIYKKYIEYETGGTITIKPDIVLLDGEILSSYRFRNNYYFMAGDNVPDSRDSRYFGLAPEEFIVGVAPKILFSKEKGQKITGISRIWKSI